jgi:hypothetical protein
VAVAGSAVPAAASAVGPEVLAAASARGPSAIPPFEVVKTELDARCQPRKEATSNLEMKADMAATADCLKRAYTADLDRALLPLKSGDRPRFDALMKEQALWNKLMEDACWLAELANWVDIEAGTLDDGTARSTWLLACRQVAGLERDYYARALASGDVAGLAQRVQALEGTGRTAMEHVRALQLGAARLRPARGDRTVGEYPRPMTEPEREELERRAKAVSERGDEVARATCVDVQGLAVALGGGERCSTMLRSYFFAQWNLAESFLPK